jgi:hypothetical protein
MTNQDQPISVQFTGLDEAAAAAWQRIRAQRARAADHRAVMQYLEEDSYDDAHNLAHQRYNQVEEQLVRTYRLAPLAASDTDTEWREYWHTVSAEYVRRYGLPVPGGAS